MSAFLSHVKEVVAAGKYRPDPFAINEDFTVTVADGSASTIEGAVVVPRDDASKFKYTSYGMVVTSGYYENSVNGTQMITEFMSDAPVFQFRTRNQKGMYTVEIDGKIVNPDGLIFGEDNVVRIVTIAAKDGVERKFRHYKIYSIITAYAAFWVGPKDTVTSNIPDTGRKFIFQLGDSYTFGTGGGYPGASYGSSPSLNDFYCFREALNLDGLAEGIAGAAWISDQEGRIPVNRVRNRLAKLQGRTPDFVSLAMGLNDASDGGIILKEKATMDKLKQRMRECINEIKLILPKTDIIVIGCATPVGAVAATDTVQQLQKEVCQEYGLQFIDVRNLITQANGWGTYTSNFGADNNHPTTTGHRVRGMHMAKLAVDAAVEGRDLAPKDVGIAFNVQAILRSGFGSYVYSGVVTAKDESDAVTVLSAQTGARVEILSISRA